MKKTLNIWQWISALFVLISVVACTKDIEIEIGTSDPIIVVDGWIPDGDYASIFLTQSFPILNDFDSASIMETFLNAAKIELFDDNGNSEILTLFKKDAYFPPFVYRTIKMKGEAGRSYSIKVTVKGHTVTAETTIPNPPDVSFSVNKVDSLRMHVIAQIDDDSTRQDFYFYKTMRLGTDDILTPSLNSTFSDMLFNGLTYKKFLEKGVQENYVNINSTPSEIDLKNIEFLLTDTVRISFSTIDETSYEVLNSTFFDIRNNENPFKASGRSISTNIEGGIGHFTGLGEVKGTVFYNIYGN